ncbi:MAG: DUF1848 domain-containing protein [Deltaproteobacteria bacterium]|nr:DUF1848 domain-containing protein [Deltaproteobacteria bacterium]
MYVISASRRTDIPAFYPKWFMNRVAAGYARVVAPFGGGEFRVSLKPEDVTAIVFWTKDAAPLLPYLDELVRMGHCFTFLYTINGYPPLVEPSVPDRSHTLEVVRSLARGLSRSVIRWRYDTIVLTDSLDRQWHMTNFWSLCRALSPFTTECIFSFCDYYRKTVRNMDRIVRNYTVPDEAQCVEMAQEMAEIAGQHGMVLSSCAHDFLVSEKVGKARCIDPEFLSMVVDSDERLRSLKGLKAAPTRKDCGCAGSRDIGAYDTCAHGCVYCYANSDPVRARKNVALISSHCECLDPRSLDAGGEARCGAAAP